MRWAALCPRLEFEDLANLICLLRSYVFLIWLFVANQVALVEVEFIFKPSEQQFASIPGKKKGGGRGVQSKDLSIIRKYQAQLRASNAVP